MRTSLAGLVIAGLLTADTAFAQTSTTYLLDFGGNGQNVFASSDTGAGDVDLLSGLSNGTGFDVDQIVGITSPTFGGGSGAIGDAFSVGAYTLTTTSTYGSYNLGTNSANNTGLFGDFFLTTGATPVTFTLSGLQSTDTVSLAFLHSQPWTISISASTTSDFSSNTVTASSTGSVDQSTTFFNLGSLTGGGTIYFSFVSTGAGEGDLSSLLVNVTSGSAIPEPSAFAMLAGLASLGFVASRRRRG